MLKSYMPLLGLVCLTASATAFADGPEASSWHPDYEIDLPGTRPPPHRIESPPDPTFRSPPARSAGIALTSIGALFTGGGSLVLIYSAMEPKGGDAVGWPVHAFIGAGLSGGGAVLASLGIPLWVWGAGKPEQRPRLSLGAGSASIGWSF